LAVSLKVRLSYKNGSDPSSIAGIGFSMAISVFDLFKVGIGPSSSHTVGPMRAAATFAQALVDQALLLDVRRVEIRLYGSLSATGVGHATDRACVMGLMGEWPDRIDPTTIDSRIHTLRESRQLSLAGQATIAFDWARDLLLLDESLPFHPNAMSLTAFGETGELFEQTYYSVGGGFIIEAAEAESGVAPAGDVVLPYDFSSAVELLELCNRHGLRVSELMMANERAWRSDDEIRQGLLHIWSVMRECVEQGMRHTIGRAGHVNGTAQAALLDDGDAPQGHGVVGDQEVLPEEEVELTGGEGPVFAAVVHGMDDHEQVGVEAVVFLGLVGLDLRRGTLVDAVFDRERMEVEHALQQLAGVFRGRILQIHPQEEVGVRQEGRHQEQVDVPRMEPSGSGEGERADHIGRRQSYCARSRRQSRETGPSWNLRPQTIPQGAARDGRLQGTSRRGPSARSRHPFGWVKRAPGRSNPARLQRSKKESFRWINENVAFCGEATCNHKIWG